VRLYEIPEIIRVAAPVYIKFGLRNAPNIYPLAPTSKPPLSPSPANASAEPA